MGEQENFLTETILIPIFICSKVIAIIRVCFSKLGKFDSLDPKPGCWLLAESRHFIQYNLPKSLSLKNFTVTVSRSLVIAAVQ